MADDKTAAERAAEAFYPSSEHPQHPGVERERLILREAFRSGAAWQAERFDVDELAEAKARAYHDSECVWKAQAEQARPVLTREQIRQRMREHRVFAYQSRRKMGEGLSFDVDAEDAFLDALLAQGDVQGPGNSPQNFADREAAIRADEREKCAQIAMRSKANKWGIAAAIREGNNHA